MSRTRRNKTLYGIKGNSRKPRRNTTGVNGRLRVSNIKRIVRTNSSRQNVGGARSYTGSRTRKTKGTNMSSIEGRNTSLPTSKAGSDINSSSKRRRQTRKRGSRKSSQQTSLTRRTFRMRRHRHNRRNKGSLHLVTSRISNRRARVPFKSVYHHDEDRNMDIRRLTKGRHRTRSSTRTLNHTRFLYSEPTSTSQRRVRSNFTGRPRRTIGTKPRLTSITRHLNTIVGGMSTIGTITRTRGRATNSSNKGR